MSDIENQRNEVENVRIFLLYAMTIIGWGAWTVVMRMSGMKPFVGAAMAAIAGTLVMVVVLGVNAPQETIGITQKALFIVAIAGIINGAGTITFQILRYETRDFLSMSLTVIVGVIAMNIVANRILIGEPITKNKAVAITFAIVTAIFASKP